MTILPLTKYIISDIYIQLFLYKNIKRVTKELKLSLKLRYSYLCLRVKLLFLSYSYIETVLISPPYKNYPSTEYIIVIIVYIITILTKKGINYLDNLNILCSTLFLRKNSSIAVIVFKKHNIERAMKSLSLDCSRVLFSSLYIIGIARQSSTIRRETTNLNIYNFFSRLVPLP